MRINGLLLQAAMKRESATTSAVWAFGLNAFIGVRLSFIGFSAPAEGFPGRAPDVVRYPGFQHGLDRSGAREYRRGSHPLSGQRLQSPPLVGRSHGQWSQAPGVAAALQLQPGSEYPAAWWGPATPALATPRRRPSRSRQYQQFANSHHTPNHAGSRLSVRTRIVAWPSGQVPASYSSRDQPSRSSMASRRSR